METSRRSSKPSLLRRLARLLVAADELPRYRVSIDPPVENEISAGLLYRLLRPPRWQTA